MTNLILSTHQEVSLPHIRHPTLLCVLWHFHTYVVPGCCVLSCVWTHTSCYAPVQSLAFEHVHHVTLPYVLLELPHIRTLRCCDSLAFLVILAFFTSLVSSRPWFPNHRWFQNDFFWFPNHSWFLKQLFWFPNHPVFGFPIILGFRIILHQGHPDNQIKTTSFWVVSMLFP